MARIRKTDGERNPTWNLHGPRSIVRYFNDQRGYLLSNPCNSCVHLSADKAVHQMLSRQQNHHGTPTVCGDREDNCPKESDEFIPDKAPGLISLFFFSARTASESIECIDSRFVNLTSLLTG